MLPQGIGFAGERSRREEGDFRRGGGLCIYRV